MSSSTAAVIEVTQALSVGSGTGAKVAEWFEGTGTPVRSLSAIFAGSVAPIDQMQMGTPCRLNSEKSSPPVVGGRNVTRLVPNYSVNVLVRRRVSAGSLFVTGTNSGVRVTIGRRSSGTPAAWAR